MGTGFWLLEVGKPRPARKCPTKCLRGPSSLGLQSVQRCPESLPGVSGHLFDTLATPFGHSFAAWRHPRDISRTPPFWATPCWTVSGALRAQRARRSIYLISSLAGRGFPNSWKIGRLSAQSGILLGRPNMWTPVSMEKLRTTKFCSLGAVLPEQPPKALPRVLSRVLSEVELSQECSQG